MKKPILKRDENSVRPRLSFCREDEAEEFKRTRSFKRPNTICTDFGGVNLGDLDKEEDRELRKPRPLSVFELARKFESNLNTGAIPKRSPLHKRNDRSRTQPITYNEFEARCVLKFLFFCKSTIVLFSNCLVEMFVEE